MLSREERILTELLVSRRLVKSEVLEERARQCRDSMPRLLLVDTLVSQGDLDSETARRVAGEAREIDGAMAPELVAGDRLGEFTLIREIGRGGMGVVYEAEQQSLGRRVALKILPAQAALDEHLVLRFLREARAIGRLRHPGIVAVYGSGNAQGVLYFAMELVEGQTLAELIDAGSPTPEDAARMALEVARALTHAHEAGLVHRDVKPENILVGRDGGARIADFGLVHEARAKDVTLSHCLLGTPAYISPEQARGETADARWDVYGLGAVLYSMLTGRQPYSGDVPAAVLGRLLTEDPQPVSKWNPDAPQPLVAICSKAMARQPQRRYASTAELAADLERFLGGETVSVQPARPSRWVWIAALAGAVGIAAAAWLLLTSLQGDAPGAPSVPAGALLNRYERLELPPGLKSFPALSRDGQRLAYGSPVDGNWHVYLVRSGEKTATNLTADLPGSHSQPAFSPDGRRLAFASRHISLEGGDLPATNLFVVNLDDRRFRRIGTGAQPSWSPDGREIAVLDKSGPREVGLELDRSLRIIDVESGSSRLLTSVGAARPAWSPGGGRIAFVSLSGGEWDLWTIASAGGRVTRVTSDTARDWSPAWAPDGQHLYFGSDRGGGPDVWRVRLDEATGEVLGEPQQVTRGFAASLFYLSIDGQGRLALLHATGGDTLFGLPFDPDSGTGLGAPFNCLQAYLAPARFADANPQGRYLAYAATTGDGEALHLLDLDSRETITLLQDRSPIRNLRWSPSGDRIGFQIEADRGEEIRLLHTRNTGPADAVLIEGTDPVWSPDGRSLAFAGAGGRVHVVPADEPQTLTDPLPPFPEAGVRFTPSSWSADGERLAGTAAGIAVYDFRTKRYRRLVDRGERPLWIGASSRLLFVDGDRIRSVDSETGETHEVRSLEPNRLVPFLSLSPDAGILYYSIAGSAEQIYLLEPGAPS